MKVYAVGSWLCMWYTGFHVPQRLLYISTAIVERKIYVITKGSILSMFFSVFSFFFVSRFFPAKLARPHRFPSCCRGKVKMFQGARKKTYVFLLISRQESRALDGTSLPKEQYFCCVIFERKGGWLSGQLLSHFFPNYCSTPILS